MGNELQTLNERIAERVGKELVDLIPEDQWQQLIDNEIKKFREKIAPELIQKAIEEAYLDLIKAVLDGMLTQEWSAEAQEFTYKELEAFIGRSSGVIVAGMLSPSMQMVIQDLRSRLY